MANASGARNTSWLQRQAPPGFAAAQSNALARAPGVPLESVLATSELDLRPSRPPEFQIENRALGALGRALANSPRTILQTLTDTVLEVLGSESAGISLVTEDGQRFYWPAIAGVWQPHIGGGTPRDFSPCGDVLDRDAPLLFRHFERRYPYLPPVEECLLVPFHVRDRAVGTIWAVTQTQAAHRFDREDLRILQSLGSFASAAYQLTESIEATDREHSALRDSHAKLRETAEDLARFNRAAVGREVRMIDLKKEVNELCAAAGQPPRYALDFESGGKSKGE
jgi:GAF domain-containing protein